MPTSDELRAALAAALVEEQLAEAKAAAEVEAEAARGDILARMAAATDPEELRALAAELGAVVAVVDPALKAEVREARRAFRVMRELHPPAEGEARPAAVETSMGVN